MSILSKTPRVLITGAAGNLGSLLARHLAARNYPLRLMQHRKPVAEDLRTHSGVQVVTADLARADTLEAALRDVDVVVHFAGVLFKPRPEKFLPETNTRWFANLLHVALRQRVSRMVLISFPHVEGPTTRDQPATGRLDRTPISVHAATRLEEEKLLFSAAENNRFNPISLRLGMVYGAGVLMIEAARYLAARRLLGVWREPTWIQLISVPDYLRATEAAIVKEGARGIYHVGDEQPITLQSFLDQACNFWGHRPPWRMPLWMINSAAWLCETYASIMRVPSPLTRDFIRIGRVSYWGDTQRMRDELLPALEYPDFASGINTLSETGKPVGEKGAQNRTHDTHRKSPDQELTE